MLHKHLEVIAVKNATMISKTTQEQLIRLCGDYIMDQIIKNVKESKYYSVLADETIDLSTKEQMTIHLRYITSNNIAEERFIGFIQVTDTTGGTLADVIWNFLVKIGLDPLMLRGQGYDGAYNMSGHIRGVAARILD